MNQNRTLIVNCLQTMPGVLYVRLINNWMVLQYWKPLGYMSIVENSKVSS